MILSGSTGMVATMSPRERRRAVSQLSVPRAALRETEERAAAARANLLVMFGALSWVELIRKSEISLDGGQIANHHRGRVGAAASAAQRLLSPSPRVLVKADADLRWPLEDVEQLAEGQIQQRHDHGDRMEKGEKVVAVTLHPRVAGREHQASH